MFWFGLGFSSRRILKNKTNVSSDLAVHWRAGFVWCAIQWPRILIVPTYW